MEFSITSFQTRFPVVEWCPIYLRFLPVVPFSLSIVLLRSFMDWVPRIELQDFQAKQFDDQKACIYMYIYDTMYTYWNWLIFEPNQITADQVA